MEYSLKKKIKILSSFSSILQVGTYYLITKKIHYKFQTNRLSQVTSEYIRCLYFLRRLFWKISLIPSSIFHACMVLKVKRSGIFLKTESFSPECIQKSREIGQTRWINYFRAFSKNLYFHPT